MIDKQTIWTIGVRSKKADRTILWDEKIPNLADPHIIIIDLNSLTEEILDSMSNDELKTISTTIFDKLLNGGTIVFITSQMRFNKSRSFSNYHLCPLKISVNSVPEGTQIIYNENNPFVTYLKNVKKFDYYLQGFDTFDNRYAIASKANCSISDISIDRISQARVTDNAGRVLGGIYNFWSSEEGPLSGELIFLPKPTEHSLDELIDDVIDRVEHILKYGYEEVPQTIVKPTENSPTEIKSLPEGQLEDRYKILTRDKRNNQIFKALFDVLFIGVFFLAISTYNQFTLNPYSIQTIMLSVGLSVSIGYLIVYFKYIPKKSLDKQEKTFMRFFKVYIALKEYEYRPNYNINKVIRSIDDLAYHIETWYGNNSPSDLIDLPKSMRDILRTGIIPSIRAKSIDHQKLKKIFYDFSSLIYQSEPTVKMLTDLKAGLNLLQTIPIIKTKIKKKSSTFTFIKLIWIAPASGLIIYFIFVYFWADKTFESASLGLGSAIAIMVAIVQLTKRK